MKLILTLIRHAPTSLSEQGLFMGSTNPPISIGSRNDIISLRKTINKYQYNNIMSSPLLRTLETAQILFPNHNIEIVDDLKERALGDWEEKTIEEVKKTYPEGFFTSGHINPYYNPTNGGEDFIDLLTRVNNFISKLEELSDKNKDTNKDYRVIAVTHNGVMRLIRCILEKRHFNEMFYCPEPYLVPTFHVYENGEWVS